MSLAIFSVLMALIFLHFIFFPSMFIANLKFKKYNIMVRNERPYLTTLHDLISGMSNEQVQGMAACVGGTTYMLDQPECVKQGCQVEPFTILYTIKMDIKIT